MDCGGLHGKKWASASSVPHLQIVLPFFPVNVALDRDHCIHSTQAPLGCAA